MPDAGQARPQEVVPNGLPLQQEILRETHKSISGTIGVTLSGMKATFRKIILLSFFLVSGSILISGCKRVVDDTLLGACQDLPPVLTSPQPPFTIEQTAALLHPKCFHFSAASYAHACAGRVQPTPNAPMLCTAAHLETSIRSNKAIPWLGSHCSTRCRSTDP